MVVLKYVKVNNIIFGYTSLACKNCINLVTYCHGSCCLRSKGEKPGETAGKLASEEPAVGLDAKKENIKTKEPK